MPENTNSRTSCDASSERMRWVSTLGALWMPGIVLDDAFDAIPCFHDLMQEACGDSESSCDILSRLMDRCRLPCWDVGKCCRRA